MDIVIDLDDVAAEFVSEVAAGSVVLEWGDLPYAAGYGTHGAFLEYLRNEFDYSELPEVPGFADFYGWAVAQGHRVVFATLRQEAPRIISATHRWLNRVLGEGIYEVHFDADKPALQGDVYVEDAPHLLCELVERTGATVIRFARPWNRHVPATCAAVTWDDVRCIVDNLTRHTGTRSDEEVRVVDPRTGGVKGSKPARFDMIPPKFLWELAEHYGRGQIKYPSDENGLPNWQRGYSWRLSYAAMQRHIHLWATGESYDQETGSHHLIAAAWHAAALHWFESTDTGEDFRGVWKA